MSGRQDGYRTFLDRNQSTVIAIVHNQRFNVAVASSREQPQSYAAEKYRLPWELALQTSKIDAVRFALRY